MLTDPPRCPGEDGDVRRARTPAPGPHPPRGDVHRPGVLQAAAGAKSERHVYFYFRTGNWTDVVFSLQASTTSRWSESSSSRRFPTPSWPGERVNSLPSIPKYPITTQSLTNLPLYTLQTAGSVPRRRVGMVPGGAQEHGGLDLCAGM